MSRASAENFVARVRAAAGAGDAMDALARDIEGFAAAIDFRPDELRLAMDRIDVSGGPAQIADEAFLSAACSANGDVVAADGGFEDVLAGPAPLSHAIHAALESARLSTIVGDGGDRPMAIAVASFAVARDWPLSPRVRAALEAGRASFAVLAIRASGGARWAETSRAFGFTGLESRVLADLLRSGALPLTAARVGIGYETAREVVETTMRKVGVRRQPDLVRALTIAAAGEFSADDTGFRAFADMFDLTLRQARLAWAIGHGATRPNAARALGMSEAAVKKDLKVVFAACSVSSAADLGRTVGEVDALRRLATATAIEPLGASSRPLRLIARRWAPGRIAMEDHGPRGFAPVVVIHTLTNGRRLPRGLIEALHDAKLRPISVERPGFGLTTPVTSAHSTGLHQEAASDLIDVLDTLSLTRVRLLGRGCAPAMAFAAAHPERVDGGVLLGPALPDAAFRTRRGLLGAVTTLMFKQPHLVDAFARVVVRGVDSGLIERLTRDVVRDCPADIAALSDPEILSDYLRSVRQAAIGGEGFLRELGGDSKGLPPAVAARVPWTVLIGAHDPLQASADYTAIWAASALAPRVVVAPDGGRLLHLTHPHLIASLLLGEP